MLNMKPSLVSLRLRVMTAAAFGAGCAIAAPMVFAQETVGFGALEEVTVTAQRREQSMQDVGVSVSAVSGSDVRALGLADAKDIAKVAPGVVFDSTAGGAINSNLTIRGVSQSDFSPNQESPNSIYIDDVYISSSSAAAFALYDVGRIEVLRGPQGTLFGRASSGGLVHFISARPTNVFEGYAEAGYGSFNQKFAEGAVSGPLSNRFRARLSARGEDTDGWFENRAPGGKDTLENRFYGVRGQLEADITDTLVGRLSLSYDKSPKYRAGIYKTRNAYVDASGQPAPLPPDLDAHGTGPGNDFAGYRDPFDDAWTGAFNNVGFFENERLTPTLYLDWSRDSVTVSSITNYTSFDMGYNEDCDGGPTDLCNFPITQDLEQWSQEIRANGAGDRLNWTTGVYFLKVDQDALIAFSFPTLTGTDFAFSDSNLISQKLTSYAAFGQLEYKLTEKLSGTIGLRYTHDRKTIASQVFFYELGNGYFGGTGSEIFDPPLVAYDFSQATVGGLAKHSEDMWSGKIQLDYRPNDDALVYASVSRGVKGPGFNTNVSGNLTNEETPFDSENLTAYETGVKLELLDRRVRLNGSVYYYDYSDFQGFAFNGLQGVVGNFEGNFRGGELEFTAVPMEGLLVSLGAAYMDTKLEDVPTTYNGVVDQESIMAPDWTLNGALRKTFNLGAGEIGLQWSFDYVGDRYASIDNTFGTFVEGSFVHNARISYTLPAQGIEVAAFVNNISEEERMNFSYDLIASTGSLLQSYARPRWWGITIRKSI